MKIKREDFFKSKVIYFSHPSFLFKTKTERACVDIIKELNALEIINPADYGIKDKAAEKISRCDAVVGVAISNKFTYAVWKEMEIGIKTGSDIYTFFVESKNDIGPLVEGIPEDVEKLSKEQSENFVSQIFSGDMRESFFSMFLGHIGRRF